MYVFLMYRDETEEMLASGYRYIVYLVDYALLVQCWPNIIMDLLAGGCVVTKMYRRRFQGLPVLLISSFVIHSNNVPKFSRIYIQSYSLYVYNKSAHCHIIFFCTITCSTIQYLSLIYRKKI